MKGSAIDTRKRRTSDAIQENFFGLSPQQRRIVLFLLFLFSPNVEDYKPYEVNMQEFCGGCRKGETSGENYQALKTAIKEACDEKIWAALDNGRMTSLHWIEKAYIDSDKGTVQLRLDNDMEPFLLQLKQQFTNQGLIYFPGSNLSKGGFL